MEAGSRFERVVDGFVRVVIYALVGMIGLVVALATVELGYLIVTDLATPPLFLLGIGELLDLFGYFLLVLIGVELLHTIQVYLRDAVVHVEIVLEVALVALARKVIVLDTAKYDGLSLLAIATLVATVSLAFFLVGRGAKPPAPTA